MDLDLHDSQFTRTVVAFLGGNGHCAARLESARAVLAADRSFRLSDIPYPGFEKRPRAVSPDAFFDVVNDAVTNTHPSLIYGTGIGGLIALCLRARGVHLETPILMQSPVLWGLEKRLMPRVMRIAPVRNLLDEVFQSPVFQARFVRRYFVHPPSSEFTQAFFQGYADCVALPDFFTWLTPSLLRRLEQDFAAHPERLENIRVWWGGKDKVVGLNELRWTEAALGAEFPVRVVPEWGHYPMIDDAESWVQMLARSVQDLPVSKPSAKVSP